jgi:restriction endonuclease Mrr
LFEVEDDDDEPILGRPEDEDEDEDVIDEEEDDDGDRRGRRRRRRRGRPSERGGEDDLPTYTVSDASDVSLPEVTIEDAPAERERSSERQERPEGRRGRDRDRDRGDRDKDRGDRDKDRSDRDRSDRDRSDRDRDRDRSDRDNDEARKDRPKRAEPAVVGRELADDIVDWLGAFRRQGGAPAQKLVEQSRRGTELLAAQVTACCYADNSRLAAEGKRPRFRFISNNRIALTEWALDKDLMRLETEMFAAIDKYRDLLRTRLARKIAELPHKSFAEFAYLLLERAGYQKLNVVKRPGAHSSELHLSGVLVAAGGETPVAIVVRKDGRDVGRERVTELRGSLHHYGSCSLGLLVTAGQVLSGARDEAAVTGATPVAFLDGAALAALCEQHGVATIPQQLTLSVPDQDLFDTLRQS